MVTVAADMDDLEREILDVVLELGRAASVVIGMADPERARLPPADERSAMQRERSALKALFEVTMAYQAIRDGVLDRLLQPEPPEQGGSGTIHRSKILNSQNTDQTNGGST
jgi:hypothetical protein